MNIKAFNRLNPDRVFKIAHILLPIVKAEGDWLWLIHGAGIALHVPGGDDAMLRAISAAMHLSARFTDAVLIAWAEEAFGPTVGAAMRDALTDPKP